MFETLLNPLFWLFVLAVLAVFAVLALAIYFGIYALAKNDILLTIVEQGWKKIRLHWGKYDRELEPGLRWVGIPGIDTLYKRKMMFLKSVTDKDGKPQAEPHEDKDVSSFKTTDYAYAFPFKDEEDSHGLPLFGILAVIAVLEDYRKAFFEASDWYSVMNSEIMPCFRDVLVQISYDDDIVGRDMDKERKEATFSQRLWAALTDCSKGRSVVQKLLDDYGIRVKSVELRSIDPPADWRATTLAPYKAQREADAAEAVATAEARKAAGPIDIAMDKWVESQREYDEASDGKKTFTETFSDARKRLRETGEYETHKALLADQINRSRKTVQERKIDLTSGGKSIEGGSVAGIAGTIAAAIIGAVAGKGIKDDNADPDNPKGGGNPGKNPSGGKGAPPKTDEQLAEDHFKMYGKYPLWDPMQRKPS